MPDFTTDVVSLNTLFSYGNYRRIFRLPQNQRQYSWTTTGQAEVLWNDLLRYTEANPDATNPNYQYYLGNLIFTEKMIDGDQLTIPATELDAENWNVFLLVDGQQRLTTLTLLLSAIRDVLQLTLNHCIQHQNVEQIPEGFDFLEGQLLNPVESQLITKRINKINQRALRDELQEHHDFHEDGITYIALDTQEQNNIRYKWRMASEGERQEQEPEAGNNRLNNNHKMFLDKLRLLLEQETLQEGEEQTDINNATAKLRGMAKLLAHDVQFTTTKVNGLGMAYRIFGTINDRGLPLSNTDLLRNFFLAEVNRRMQNSPEEEAEYLSEIEGLWNEIWQMEPSLQDSFLMNHWSIWRPDDDDLEEAESDVEVAAIEDEIDVQGDEILEDTDLGEVENDEEEDEDLDAELVATLELRSWVPSKGLNKKIQSYIESEMDNVVDMMNWIRNLSTSAEVYTQVSNTPRPRDNTVDSYLADFGSKVHYPFFLALEYHRTLGENPVEVEEGNENQRTLTDDQIDELKKMACKFFMWVRHVFTTNTTPVKCMFSKWGSAVIRGAEYDTLVEMMQTDIPIFIEQKHIPNQIEEVVNELSRRRYKGKNAQVKRFMCDYNELIVAEQEIQAVQYQNLWLEHILPQSIVKPPYHTQNKQWWIENFTLPIGEEAQQEQDEEDEINIINEPSEQLSDYIWSLGNCTILSSSANRGVGNTKFESEEAHHNPQPQQHPDNETQLVYLSKYHAIRRSNLHLNGNYFRDSIRENPENENWGQDLLTTVWTSREVEFRSNKIANALANSWKFW